MNLLTTLRVESLEGQQCRWFGNTNYSTRLIKPIRLGLTMLFFVLILMGGGTRLCYMFLIEMGQEGQVLDAPAQLLPVVGIAKSFARQIKFGA